MLHTCTTVYFHYWRWKWSNYFVNNTSVSPLVKRNYEETLHTNPVYITLYHKFYVTLISVCSIAVALVIQWHLLDHIPLTYQFFCISVSFHQTSAGFEVGFHSRSGRYHCGSRRQTQKDVRDNYACNSIKMKQCLHNLLWRLSSPYPAFQQTHQLLSAFLPSSSPNTGSRGEIIKKKHCENVT